MQDLPVVHRPYCFSGDRYSMSNNMGDLVLYLLLLVSILLAVFFFQTGVETGTVPSLFLMNISIAVLVTVIVYLLWRSRG